MREREMRYIGGSLLAEEGEEAIAGKVYYKWIWSWQDTDNYEERCTLNSNVAMTKTTCLHEKKERKKGEKKIHWN